MCICPRQNLVSSLRFNIEHLLKAMVVPTHLIRKISVQQQKVRLRSWNFLEQYSYEIVYSFISNQPDIFLSYFTWREHEMFVWIQVTTPENMENRSWTELNRKTWKLSSKNKLKKVNFARIILCQSWLWCWGINWKSQLMEIMSRKFL